MIFISKQGPGPWQAKFEDYFENNIIKPFSLQLLVYPTFKVLNFDSFW